MQRDPEEPSEWVISAVAVITSNGQTTFEDAEGLIGRESGKTWYSENDAIKVQ
jgi:hypothetical protein